MNWRISGAAWVPERAPAARRLAAAALVAGMFVAATRLAADDASPATAAPREDLTAAVRFERDRSLEELLGRTDALLREHKAADAIQLLEEVLTQSAAKLVYVEGTFRNAAAEANRRLALLPQAELDRYERLAGDAALGALREAEHSGDIDTLQRLLVRYRHTAAGRRGLRNLAQSLCDQGKFDESVLACTALIDESPQPADELVRDPDLALLWCTAAIRSENLALALGLRQRFAEVLERTPVAAQIDGLLSAAGAATVTSTDVVHIPDGLPSAVLPPVWSNATGFEIGGDWNHSLQYLSSNSVPPVAALQPVATNRGVACRTWEGVVMFADHSGEQLWTHSPSPPTGRDPRVIDATVRRSLGDSVHMGLVADREYLYFLATLPNSGEASDPSPLSNELVALRLDSGALAWRLPSRADPASAAPIPTFFRGPPTACGAQLLVVAERESVIRLLTLERTTGGVLSDIPLCSTETGTVRDDRRLAQACPIRVVGNLAICGTGGGAVVAVDRMSGSVRWAFRYPRERLPGYLQDAPSHGQPVQVLWADGWRVPTLMADERYVVFASGESQQCRVLDTKTGRPVWSLPRGDGMYVATVTQERIILAGRNELRAYGIADGNPAWRAVVGPIAGRGFDTPTQYVVPLADYCVASVELRTGEVFRTWPQNSGGLPSESASSEKVIEPISLVWTAEGIVAQSLTQVWQPEPLVTARTAALDPATLPFTRAKLLGETSQFVDAIRVVRDSLNGQPEGTQPEIDEAVELIADLSLQQLRVLKEPSQLDDAYAYGLSGAGRFPRDPRRRLALHWDRLSRLDSGEHRCSEIARAISSLHSDRHYAWTSDDAGRVRVDRAVQARLLELRARLEPAERQSFDASFENWDLLAGNPLPVELQIGVPTTAEPRLADLFDHLPFGQTLRLQQPQRWTSTAEFLTTQLKLLEQSRIAEPPLGAAALRHLLQLYSDHSDPADASGVLRRLRDEFSGVVLPDGTEIATIVEEASADSATAQCLSGADEWPDVTPTVTSRPWPEGEIYFVPVSVQHTGGGLFDRLNVAVHRQGKIVRFSGAGMPRPWALTLPDSRNPLRSSQSYPDLRRAWGFGQFLVLQVGAEVFGISPLNAAGEPRAAIVWPPTGELLSTTFEIGAGRAIDTGPALDLRVAPFDEAVERRNEFGHLVGRVGPVRAGYFCVQREGSLIAFDTSTGVELWERRQLPPGIRCYGDDRLVIIHDPGSGQFTRLSALDGRPLDAAPFSAPGENWLTVNGCTVLIERPVMPGADDPHHTLWSFDLALNSEAWRRMLPPQSVCFPVDDRWCGVLSPDGALQFLRLADGVTIAEHSLAVPRPLIHVRSLVDAHRILVLISGMRDDDGLEAATRGGGVHTNENYRRLIVNGEWSAFDRRTGEHLWTQPLDNASLLLDQPVDVPVLVCNEQRIPADGNAGAFVGRVRVFDRRHGGLLFDEASSGIHNYFVVERDVDAGWVELRLPGRVVRFDYSSVDAQNR